LGGTARRTGLHGAVLDAGTADHCGVAFVAARAAGDATASVGQHAAERVAKLAVEDAVYDRVHGAVDVAEPREDGEDERRHAAGTAQRADEVDREERTPRHAGPHTWIDQ